MPIETRLRRRTVATRIVRHPVSKQVLQIKMMDDGNFDIVIKNPNEGVKRMYWSIAGLFTGGKTGTRMRLIEIDASDLDDEDE